MPCLVNIISWRILTARGIPSPSGSNIRQGDDSPDTAMGKFDKAENIVVRLPLPGHWSINNKTNKQKTDEK